MTSCRCTCTRSRWWAACSVTTRVSASRRWASRRSRGRAAGGLLQDHRALYPKLVSWNGSGFDLPVLHYRSLILGVPAPLLGHGRGRPRVQVQQLHLALPQPPHRPDGPAGQVQRPRQRRWTNCQALRFSRQAGHGRQQGLGSLEPGPRRRGAGLLRDRRGNTWLVYTRFRFLRGELDPVSYEAEIALVRDTLSASDAPHWKEYLDAWKG